MELKAANIDGVHCVVVEEKIEIRKLKFFQTCSIGGGRQFQLGSSGLRCRVVRQNLSP